VTLAWAPLLLATALAAGGYLVLAARWRSRHGRAWSPWRSTSWLAWITMSAAAAAPPISTAAHHDPVVHMMQHLVWGCTPRSPSCSAPPVTLALGALPTIAARRITGVLRSRPVHLLTRPVTAVALSAGGLWVLYATPLYGLTTASPTAYTLVLVHLGEWPPAAHGSVDRMQEAAQLMYYGGDVAELLLAALVLRVWFVRSAPRAVPATAAG
jgi:putative membrane protein